MAMNDQQILAFAQQMIRRNQGNIPNTPWAKAAVDAIMNGDSASGAQIADNLCQSYGTTRQGALQQMFDKFMPGR